MLVDDRKPLDRATVFRAIEDEVPGPDVIFVLGPMPNAAAGSGAQSPLFSLFLRHLQTLPPPQAVHPLAIHVPAFTFEQHPDEAIAVTRMRAHQLQHSLDQPLFFFVFARSISLRAPRLTQDLAGPTLAPPKA